MMRTLGESGNSLHLRWLLSSFCFFARFKGFRGHVGISQDCRFSSGNVPSSLGNAKDGVQPGFTIFGMISHGPLSETSLESPHHMTRGQTGSVLSRSRRHGFFGSYWPVDENPSICLMGTRNYQRRLDDLTDPQVWHSRWRKLKPLVRLPGRLSVPRNPWVLGVF